MSFDPGVIYSELGLFALERILAKTEVLFTTEEELQNAHSRPAWQRRKRLQLLQTSGSA